jgi:hypothetical protein
MKPSIAKIFGTVLDEMESQCLVDISDQFVSFAEDSFLEECIIHIDTITWIAEFLSVSTYQ